MRAAAITLVNLAVGYDGHPVIHDVEGCIEAGSLTAIIGPNGAGKSTLVKAIAGVLEPARGYIDRHGADPHRDFAYLPQQAEIDRSFPINVMDLVAAGLWHESGAFRGIGTAGRGRIEEAMVRLGLQGFSRRPIGSLSAGQFQRAQFARLLLQSAPIVLLDEPFNALDARTTAQLLEVVRHWHAQGRTVIAVLHDLDQVRRHFPRSLLLARRMVAWGATEQVLSTPHLQLARSVHERCAEDAGGDAAMQADDLEAR